MLSYCTPCNRSFRGRRELDQHIQDSSAHKNQEGASLVELVNRQALGPATKREHREPPCGSILSSTIPMVATLAVQNEPHCGPWSVILEPEYVTVLNALSAHCHTPIELEENGFNIHPYVALNDSMPRKCKRCNSQEDNAIGRECIFHLNKRNKWNLKRPYKCCNYGGKGCKTLPTHDFQTPLRVIRHQDSRQTPPASAQPKFRAVALDCEMAGVAGGASKAILLCITDYVTGAVLLDRYVSPQEPITHMRSSIHGISKSTLEHATRQGQTLLGWEGARSELWKYIDSNTIIVGHALEHDLDVLRMIHPRIVDSGILSRKAAGIHRIRWGLQKLCSELVHIEIRNNKGVVHDCLEDVLATREVVLFCTRRKEAFQAWAEAKRTEELFLEKERESRKQVKQSKDDAVTRRGRNTCHTYPDSDDEVEEVLHWSLTTLFGPGFKAL